MARSTPRTSEKSDAVMRGIRAELITRGTSLRGWVAAWADANGRARQAAYQTAISTIRRQLERGLAPQGSEGAAIVDALRADLGSAVVPYPRGKLEHTERSRVGRGRRATPADGREPRAE